MRVKRFVGDTVTETMGKVKKELGSEAVILQTREFREGGFLVFFGKIKIEITAAIEEKPIMTERPEENLIGENEELGAKTVKTVKTAETAQTPKNIQTPQTPQTSPSVMIAAYSNPVSCTATPGPNSLSNSPEQNSALHEEIKSMRRMLEKMNKQLEVREEVNSVWPPVLQKWADYLKDRGINDNLIQGLISHVQQTLPPEAWGENSQVYARIEANIRRICGQIGLIQPGYDRPRIVALIGPTGVGKTTTIGKLAAGFSIVDKRKVALITADTYRVAAVEQLKTFGEIIRVPVEVVMSTSGLTEALQQHEDKELIFIDTAGRSPNDNLHLSKLRSFLDIAQPDFTMLVMSATTQFADQLRIYQRFEPLTTHLIFTKLDETASAGSILNLIGQTTLPTAYLTNGQNVPDDIQAATANLLARYVMGEEMPHV